mgnify:CR=1 FL=1|jgi:uncharacterized membrane protein
MTRYIAAYLATLIVFLAIDFVWLSSMANTLYRPVLKEILLPDFRLAPAIVFYLLFALGLVIFGVSAGIRSGNWTDALLFGALFGFFCYATYDLTNQATLKNWETRLSVIDMAWGTVVSGAAATAGYFLSGWIERAIR